MELHLGDLDQHYAHDRLEGVLNALTYSTDDERRSRPNPTSIPINGILRTNLASYKDAAKRYRAFRDGETLSKRPSAGAIAKTVTLQKISPEDAWTLSDFEFDGQAALNALIAASRYRAIAQAVAALTVFSHPLTVAQTGGRALFPSIRGVPGRYLQQGDRVLLLDDNKSPTDAFLWSNALGRRGRDTQFNHIYAVSSDVDAYTALPNICMTPAFLAKLTDTNAEVRALLAYRTFDLYGWTPAGFPAPERPDGYSDLRWADPLPSVNDLAAHLTRVMARRPKDRTVIAARRLGWLFGAPIEGDPQVSPQIPA